MPTRNLLYKTSLDIDNRGAIRVMIPEVGEILDDEENYYNLVFMLTAVPMDVAVQLEDSGYDFTKITEFELFLILFQQIQKMDTHLVFGDLDLTRFQYARHEKTNEIMLVNPEGVRIDRLIKDQIAQSLRLIHHLEKNNRKPANIEFKEYFLKLQRSKLKRAKRRKSRSQLEGLIVSLVNTEQYKYDFESTKHLTIYQFNECVHQIIRKVNFDNRMRGVYAGTIDAKKLSQDELTWLKQDLTT